MSPAIGQQAPQRFTEEAAEAMRAAISETGGREVYFAGDLGPDGRVATVRVCARGSNVAVPALREALRRGEISIHNHPSGDVAPSTADLNIAAELGYDGHGVYIVDNDVTRAYVVVEPFQPQGKHKLDLDGLGAPLMPEGRLAKAIPGYERREQQLEMARAVGRAFNEQGIAVIEAPTGVGKTLAYLLPAVQWALSNRERVVIATRTINLQEQVIHKDIPLLEKCLDEPFKAVLVKGRGNYLCWRKLERALSEETLFGEEEGGDQIEAIAEWAETSEEGSRSDLPFVPDRDLWSRLCSEADVCSFTQCPQAEKCFVMKARRELAKADVIVANHHILFSDLAVRREQGRFNAPGVLPSYRRVIFDEAHNIEDSATEYFGAVVSRKGVLDALGRLLRRERRTPRGLVPFIKNRVMKGRLGLDSAKVQRLKGLIDEQIAPGLAELRSVFMEAFDAVRELAAERCEAVGRDIKWRLTPDILQEPALRDIYERHAREILDEYARCDAALRRLADELRDVEPVEEGAEPPFLTDVTQLEAYRARLERQARGFAQSVSATLPDNTVRWIEIDSEAAAVCRLVDCPLEVAEPLSEWVYPNLYTVIMTSATLTVRHKFDYLMKRLGVDRVTGRALQTLTLDSPFDFQRQALLCVATSLAAPNDPVFLEETIEELEKVLTITKGRAFALFTSFYALRHAHRALEPVLGELGITALRQGAASRRMLIERFRQDVSSVLFGTDSFWEGVDVAGEALQCVILARLPFRVPTEPVLQARTEAIEAAGGNAFMEFTIPQAVIKFRQGFGRLIRRATDRGAIVVLDSRIVTRRYGRVFLESLPDVRTVRGDSREVGRALAEFFNNKG